MDLQALLADFPNATEATRLADAALSARPETAFASGGSTSRAEFDARRSAAGGLNPLQARLSSKEKK